MTLPQVLGLLILVGLGAFLFVRSTRKPTATGPVQPGLDALRSAFAQSRSPDENEPVCVVAFHHSIRNVAQVTVGVTDRRILVVKGHGTVHSFPYDDEGEHLPVQQKMALQRGFFHWKHGRVTGGTTAYCPTVKQHAPFAGEQWRMPPMVQGFPEQTANLKEFSRRFYFQWFYN